jgi:hypothetical protein
MAFGIGQKVVCIAEISGDHGFNDEARPVKGVVYTIRDFEYGYTDETIDMLFLLFEEIVNRPRAYEAGFLEASFWSAWFRPLVETKTDIAIFEKMLKPAKVNA